MRFDIDDKELNQLREREIHRFTDKNGNVWVVKLIAVFVDDDTY